MLPIFPGWKLRFTPLDVQAASYLAASERIVNFSNKSMTQSSSTLSALFGLIQTVDQMHHVDSKGPSTENGNDKS